MRARGGGRAAIHVNETRLGSPRRVEAVFEKQIVLHAFKRGAAAPVSTRDAVEPKAGMVAGATTRQPLLCLRVSRGTFRKMAGFAKVPQARMQRTLALIQLSVIGESCIPKFRNACQEYEAQRRV